MRSAVYTSTFRQAVRPRRLPTQSSRFASSTTETAQKKAQDALGSAQKTAEKLWESSKTFLGPLGERAGTMLGCTSSCGLLPL
jgi:F-type H+-transporting ATPase subunit g